MRKPKFATIQLEKIVGGGQALGTLDDGRKAFVWGGLPGETVTIRITKKKSHFVEGVVTEVLAASPERITPRDPESYLSTSPWQIMPLASEQHYKAALIEEAFELHNIVLPEPIDIFCDGIPYGYRNKVELSWYSDRAEDGTETLDLAFFRRGSKGKIVVDGTSLARPEINQLARQVREMQRNIHQLGRRGQAKAVLAPSEQALEYITGDALIILDPPRAGLHADVIAKLLAAQPQRILYLSCNPVTQARDVALLATHYGIAYHRGYNFFPRTPHSEHLVVLDRLT